MNTPGIEKMPRCAVDVAKAVNQIRSNQDLARYWDSARCQRNDICHEYPNNERIWATQGAMEGMKAITIVGREIQNLRTNVLPTVYNELENLEKAR